ncbi:MAG: hypothetical protein GEU95_17680 [Rhizobiales bacterium]|nr:hypothetical protein [Hyphomicrobiales bacterium]
MTRSVENIRNVIICDDIRDEVGNKQSLMGIFGGDDIIVAAFPAAIHLAVFMQYFPAPSEEDGRLTLQIELSQDESLMARGTLDIDVKRSEPATIVMPRALATFKQESLFKVEVSLDGGPKQQIAQKRVKLGDISNRPS